MPKKIELTMEQETLMADLFRSVPRDIGRALRRPKNSIKPVIQKLRDAGITLCEDTIRRYAVKRGYIEPVGAKYTPAPIRPMWNRPCMRCKCTKTRPRFQYICNPCTLRHYD